MVLLQGFHQLIEHTSNARVRVHEPGVDPNYRCDPLAQNVEVEGVFIKSFHKPRLLFQLGDFVVVFVQVE